MPSFTLNAKFAPSIQHSYYCMRALIFLAASLGILFSAHAQIELNETAGPDFKDGIYLSYEDFKLNRPSWPVDSLPVEVWKAILRDNCPTSAGLFSNTSIFKESNIKQVWGVCIKGRPYIQHLPPGPYCFRTMVTTGRFCLLGRVIQPTTYQIDANPFKSSSGYIDNIRNQYVLDSETGEIYKLPYDQKNIARIIKEDPKFYDEKIRGKDILYYISLYNTRHPLAFKANTENP